MIPVTNHFIFVLDNNVQHAASISPFPYAIPISDSFDTSTTLENDMLFPVAQVHDSAPAAVRKSTRQTNLHG